MKRMLLMLSLFLMAGAFTQMNAQRYLSEVFTDVTKTSDVMYGQNITVIASPTLLTDTLRMDVYEPTGDTLSERPVVIYIHTGSFLPTPANGQTTGSKNDSAAVEICTQFAKRGYVAIAMSYRFGWNPVSSNQDVRTGTLLNAAYRGIQDYRTLVRYLRMSVDSMSNPYAVDTDAIIALGQGTGGYISFGAATLDSYAEITLSKFLDSTATPYVDTALSGNSYGFGGSALNIENYPGYSSDFHFAVNMGGAMGDSSWLEAGDVPMVSFHVPNDPFAPYGDGAVIVPTTGDFVVNVSGSSSVLADADGLGNQDCFKTPAAGWTDPYTTRANAVNGGVPGLFPFFRPTPESAPWEWWDPSHPNDSASSLTNPDMSKAKALAYIDTIMGYANPRIVACLGLDTNAVGVEEMLVDGEMVMYPNPMDQALNIRSTGDAILSRIEVFDLQGRLAKVEDGLNQKEFTLDRSALNSGLYMVKVITNKGVLTRRILMK